MIPHLHESVATLVMQRSFSSWRFVPRWPLINCLRPGRAGMNTMRRRCRYGFGRILMASGLALLAVSAHALDANTASAEQLESLNGVGPGMAKTIVQERDRAGPYESLEDLSERVRGIGRKRLGRLRAAGLTVSGGVTVFGPNTVAMPQFAPSLPEAIPVKP